ncbi:MAG: hypothetical protein NT009_14080, partial [Proteobacteria bacterium]|nr:hypothetical protein [Pseudomonadota bacterium]
MYDLTNLLIEAAGFSRDSGLTVFLVGGAVRDLVLVREIRDLDFLVIEPGGAKKLADYFHRKLAFHRPVLFAAERKRNEGEVKTRRTCPERSRRVDTYQTAREDLTLNIVPPRAPGLVGDLQLRDFTINTLIIPLSKLESGKARKLESEGKKVQSSKFKNNNSKLETRNLIKLVEDPLGAGKKDLRQKLIRTPVNPELTISDDPLRMIRAVRLARELKFRIAPGLRKEIRRSRVKMSSVSAERIRDELEKLILLPAPSQGFLLLEDLKLL